MTSRLLDALAGDEEIERLFTDEAELAAILRFEAALAEAEAAAGLIAPDAARRIDAATQNFKPDWPHLAEGIARDGVVVPALIQALRKAIGEPFRDAVHFGATSQDAVDTALVLRLVEVLEILEARLAGITARLGELAAEYGRLALTARTRMQDAMPFTVADKIETWRAPLIRQRARLRELRPRVLVLQLGGPVGERRSFKGEGDAVAAGLAKRLGLVPAPAWHSQRDSIVELGDLLALLCGSLGKLGQDVLLMGQNERREVVLEGGGGSSAMPHKSNPVAAEVLVALARYSAALTGGLHQAMVHENERSGSAWTLEWLILPKLAVAAGASLRQATGLLAGLSFAGSASR